MHRAKKIIHCISDIGVGGSQRFLKEIIEATPELQHVIIYINEKGDFLNFKSVCSIYKWAPKLLLDKELFKGNLIFQGWLYHGDFLSVFLGKIFGKPYNWNIRNNLKLETLKKVTRLEIKTLALFSRLKFLNPNIIIGNTKRGLYSHQAVGYDLTQSTVIPNFSNFECKNRRDKHFTVGWIGRQDKIKNIGYLKQIMKELENDKISILVAGLDEKFIHQDNLSQIFGSVDRNEFFSEVDLVISTSFTEGLPNVFLECLNSERIYMSVDNSDIYETLLPDQRLPWNDAREAARRVELLASSSTTRSKIITHQNVLRQSFLKEKIVKKYLKVWNVN